MVGLLLLLSSCNSLKWQFADGRSKLPLWPGSRWPPSASSRRSLQERRKSSWNAKRITATTTAPKHKKTNQKNPVNNVVAQKHTRPGLTSVVGQSPVVHVKEEPSLLPRLDSPPSLGQEAGAASGRQSQVGAGGHAVTQGLQVGAKVEVGREEEWQLLGTQAEFRSSEEDFWQRKGRESFTLSYTNI